MDGLAAVPAPDGARGPAAETPCCRKGKLGAATGQTAGGAGRAPCPEAPAREEEAADERLRRCTRGAGWAAAQLPKDGCGDPRGP